MGDRSKDDGLCRGAKCLALALAVEVEKFPLDPPDGKFFYKEMEQLHSTLSGDHIETVAKKRPADDLVNDTPHKTRQRQL